MEPLGWNDLRKLEGAPLGSWGKGRWWGALGVYGQGVLVEHRGWFVYGAFVGALGIRARGIGGGLGDGKGVGWCLGDGKGNCVCGGGGGSGMVRGLFGALGC